ncbi:hypothetical protein GW17_00041248 [Ensete ventricosum]|nr:hypothetical protein GW17_00041248 [Ensete ventricosum]
MPRAKACEWIGGSTVAASQRETGTCPDRHGLRMPSDMPRAKACEWIGGSTVAASQRVHGTRSSDAVQRAEHVYGSGRSSVSAYRHVPSRSPMAPSAAILFLSYQQWKPKPSPQPLPGAPPPPPPAAAATSFLVKFSRSPVSRPSSPPAAAQAKAKSSDATTKRHPTTEDKFQEALELGCWSL